MRPWRLHWSPQVDGIDVNDASIEEEIHALEQRRDAAMLRGDAEAVAELLSDSLVYTYWSGASDGKVAYVEGLRSGRFDYRVIERPDERIQVYANTAVVVTGRAHIEVVVGGTPRAADVRYTSLWVKEARGWQVAAYQTTPILS
jgi:ketosteroid isomerase-like protein